MTGSTWPMDTPQPTSIATRKPQVKSSCEVGRSVRKLSNRNLAAKYLRVSCPYSYLAARNEISNTLLLTIWLGWM